MPVKIDIPTLIIFLGFTHMMQVLVFFHQYKVNKSYNGPGWWLLWSAAEVIGFEVMYFRNITSLLPLIIIIQNTMIVAGTIFLYIGVCRFGGKKVNLKIIIPGIAAFLAGLFWFSFVDNNLPARSFIISVTLAGFSFLTAYSLYSVKIHAIRASSNFNVIIFIVHGGIFVYRSVMILTGTSVTDFYAPTFFNYLPYFDAATVSLLWTFGLIMMLNQRLHAGISEVMEDLKLIFKTSPDAAIITRMEDGLFVDLNEGYTAITGYTREDMAGKAMLDINLWKNFEDRNRAITLLKEQGYLQNFESIFVRKDGKEITGLLSAKIFTLQGIPHMFTITRDISSRKIDEKRITKANRVYAVISQINQTIVHIKNRDEVFSEVCRIAVETGEFQMAWIGMVDEQAQCLQPVAFAGVENGYLSEIKKITIKNVPEGCGPTGTAVREGRCALCNDIENDPKMEIWKARALERGYRSSIALPISFFGKVIGAFTLYSNSPFFFDKQEITLLEEVTNNIGFSLEVLDTEEKHKLAVTELAVSEEKYRNIFDTTFEGIYQSTPQGRYVSVNPAFAEILGFASPEELVKSVSDIGAQIYADPRQRLKIKQLLAENGVVKDFEAQLIKKDGSLHWVLINSKTIRNDQGKLLYYQGGMMDITDRKNAEEVLKESSRKWQTTFDAMKDAIFLLDVDGKILQANNISFKFFGKKEEELVSRYCYQVVHNNNCHIVNCPFVRMKLSKQRETMFLPINDRWYEIIIDPILDDENTLTGAVHAAVDITERKLAEQAIANLTETLEQKVIQRTAQLESTNQELEAFTYSVSHDLRAPLRHISGYVDLLAQRFHDSLTEQGVHYIDTIADSAKQMGELIDGLLQFSRTGRQEMREADVDINELVQEVIESMKEDYSRRNIEWIIGDLPHIVADYVLLRVVWINLLSNAIKFTRTKKTARIEIGYRLNSTEFVFYVRDNGAGFEMQYAHKLFGVFQRLHTTEEFEGTGIGLANVRRIIFRHGGRTWAEAKPGEGATFYFSLPIAKENNPCST